MQQIMEMLSERKSSKYLEEREREFGPSGKGSEFESSLLSRGGGPFICDSVIKAFDNGNWMCGCQTLL